MINAQAITDFGEIQTISTIGEYRHAVETEFENGTINDEQYNQAFTLLRRETRRTFNQIATKRDAALLEKIGS